MSSPDARAGQRIGRYVMYDEIASGGMATVHVGRLIGPAGFARTVAVKRLHASYASDPAFVTSFLDEARLAARIRHPNVASTLDVVAEAGDLFLVLDYVHGESLSRLWRAARDRGERIPVAIASSVLGGVLDGLHAAHEARSDHGEPLSIVHRDVSPQNVIVGADGLARVLDFGIAKAAWSAEITREGQLKGKLGYMAPEQIVGHKADRRADVFAAAVMLWELVTGRRLFGVDAEVRLTQTAGVSLITRPSSVAPDVAPDLDAIVMRGLAPAPAGRFETARAMAIALERAVPPASAREVGAWVESIAGPTLERRSVQVGDVESRSSRGRGDSQPDPVETEQTPMRVSQVPTEVSGVVAVAPLRAAAHAPEEQPTVTEPSLPVHPPLDRTPRALFLVLGGIAAIAVLGFALTRGISAGDGAPRSSASAPPASPPIAPAPPAVSTPVEEPAPEPPASSPSARSEGATHPPPRPKDCQVPYVIGADGIKRFKPECLVPKSRTR